MPERPADDIFQPSGRLRPDVVDSACYLALRESLAHARGTNWDSLRTPHLFMGLLSAPDSGVFNWADRLGVELGKLLDQFRELFFQDADPVPPLLLNREFLSDNVIRLLRDAHDRAREAGRRGFTQMDLLVSMFAAPNGIVAECFERTGITAAHLTDLAVQAERETTGV